MAREQTPEVVFLDSKSAPRLIPFGNGFLRERLPVGTRVIYAPPPLEALADPDAAIRQALVRPLDADPLHAQLRPGMKVTIAIDDISLPLPPMRRPDIRERVLRIVLQFLADYGVDDVHLIIAVCLHRRMTEPEIRRMVGDDIFKEFYPDRLYNFDAEDEEEIVTLGYTDHDEEVAISRRAAESDLLIYVNINLVPMDGGHKSVAVGLAPYRSVRHHHNPETLLKCHSYMDPQNSALHRSCDRMGAIVQEHANVFAIETTINNQMYPAELDFLAKNEDEFTELDDLKVRGFLWLLDKTPPSLVTETLRRFASPYGMTSVFAGKTDSVHARALEMGFRQYAVPVEGQSDILLVGVPFICPYNVNSVMNPVLVQVTGLGYLFNMYRGKPLVRPGGTIIICHPLPDDFDPESHPSYIEFFKRCLTETRSSFELSKRFEEQLATDPTYIQMYRRGHAYHGAHPFYMWYWGDPGRAHLGRVIAAGAEDPAVASTLGWESAPSVAEAIAMARSDLGPSASITYLHLPPIMIADVTAP